jgi:hypothetical protein
MFFLSPLLLLARLRSPDMAKMDKQAIQEHIRQTHRVPPRFLNATLHGLFALESPLGLDLPFPWGTSVLAVLRRPP